MSVAAPTLEALAGALPSAGAADLVEVRLDALEAARTGGGLLAALEEWSPGRGEGGSEAGSGLRGLAALVDVAPVPVLFTCRPAWEGGGFQGPETDRRRVLEEAAGSGAALVDVELDAPWVANLRASSPVPVVVSHHWEVPRPSDLEERARAAAALEPGVVKLVVPAERVDEAVPVLEAGRRLVESGQPATAFCIGEAGRASRVLAATCGASLVYAALPGRPAVAAGQWSLPVLRDDLRLARWGPGTVCCGLLGHPLGHSLSPAIFNAAFAAAGLSMGYLPVDSPEVGPALDLAGALEFRGLSVTMPFKEEAARRCVELEPLAAAIGAVNTLVAGAGGWHGHNTDAGAVVEALEGRISLDGAAVGIVGAGGAARAAAVALGRAGARVTVMNRTPGRAATVARQAGGEAASVDRIAAGGLAAIVHATPVGMAGGGHEDELPFDPAWLSGEEVVFDMVYRPRRTPLLAAAAARGCRTVDGLEMFLRQAAAQYRLWTDGGREAPLAIMEETATARLEQDLRHRSHDRVAGGTLGADPDPSHGNAPDPRGGADLDPRRR